MKKLIYLPFLLILSKVDAQMVVEDPEADAQLASSSAKQTQSNFLQNAIKGYNYLMAKIQNSTLGEVTQTAKGVSNQFNLLNAALDVADAFQQSQMVKDFFVKQSAIISQINTVNQSLYNTDFVMNAKMRQAALNLLNDAYVNAAKSLSVIANGFIKKQLNLSERMVFCEKAASYLTDALSKVQQAASIIEKATADNAHIQNKSTFIKAVF
ncbi:MAG TPA: hypothetical protein VN616_18465 [Puia sp.]|nr:hypothetical protein [Puia sp.]